MTPKTKYIIIGVVVGVVVLAGVGIAVGLVIAQQHVDEIDEQVETVTGL
jgi:hypothetical protein